MENIEIVIDEGEPMVQPGGGLPPKTVDESAVTMAQLMMPADANPHGNVHGGVLLRLMDNAAGVVATRHCRSRVVTARLDDMSFLKPVLIGDLVFFKAAVNGVGRTSLEIGVRVESEDLFTGKVVHVATAYFIYVALDDQDKPAPVPGLIAATPEQKQRMIAAAERRDARQKPAEEAPLKPAEHP